MKVDNNMKIPVKGMDTDTHASRLSDDSYIFALNTSIEEYVGSGVPLLQNEPSNLLCSKFKEGYKVVGFKSHIQSNRVYFFLTNPQNGRSEIGFIEGTPQLQTIDEVEVSCGCDIRKVLQSLEDNIESLVSSEICNYRTLVGDNCTDSEGNFLQKEPCLNFSLKYPIKDGNIIIKTEKVGDKIYWTDGLNPPRYFDTFLWEDKDGEFYKKKGLKGCDDEDLEDVCIDCEKLEIFRRYSKPCLEVESVVSGGNLPMGIYQFVIAYCDINGNELSPYFSMTNPVSLFDEHRDSYSLSNLNANSKRAISLKVSNLDSHYSHYKIVVIKRNDAHFNESYVVEGVHPISVTRVIHDREHVENERITLDRIMDIKAIYDTASIMSTSGGYLFQAGLTVHPEINLQPVVNLMGGFLEWRTGEAKDDLYVNGANVANFTGYMRDEIYPFAIRFTTDRGFVTPVFPLVPPPPDSYALEDYTETINYKSVTHKNSKCNIEGRSKRWQFMSTAKNLGMSPSGVEECNDNNTDCVRKEVVKEGYCTFDVFDKVLNETWEFTPDGEYESLGNEITRSYDIVKGNNNDLYDILQKGPSYVQCNPIFNDDGVISCGESSLKEAKFIVSNVVEKNTEYNPKMLKDYILLQDVNDEFEQEDTFEADEYNYYPQDVDYKKSLTTFTIQGLNVDERFLNTNCIDIKVRNKPSSTSSKTPCNAKELKQGVERALNVYNGVRVYSGYEVAMSATHKLLDSCDTTLLMNATKSLEGNGYMLLNAHQKSSLLKAFSDKKSNVSFSKPLSLGYYEDESISDKNIFVNATWLKIKPNSNNEPNILDFSRSEEVVEDDLTADEIRVSLFRSCDDESAYRSFIVNRKKGKVEILRNAIFFEDVSKFPKSGFNEVIYVDKFNNQNYIWDSISKSYVTTDLIADFADNKEVFISIDTPLLAVSTKDSKGSVTNSEGEVFNNFKAIMFLNQAIDSGFRVVNRSIEYASVKVFVESLTVKVQQTFEKTCDVWVRNIESCGVVPYQRGTFGYYESLEEYPNNGELYDSSELKVPVGLFKNSNHNKFFEQIYVDSEVNGNYKLTSKKLIDDVWYGISDLTCTKIRHYRFPDNITAPFMGRNSHIYPLGVHLDTDVISKLLDVAVINGLITKSFRDSINGYEILRGNRTLDKSIVAKGLLFDMYEYQEYGQKYLYSNYPYNDLGSDKLHIDSARSGRPLKHIGGGKQNHRFTFHSPDIHFANSLINPSELFFDGYQFGKSRGKFAQVDGHPKWVILGPKSFSRAKLLATLEVVFDSTMTIAEMWSRYNPIKSDIKVSNTAANSGGTLKTTATNTTVQKNTGLLIALGLVAAFKTIQGAIFNYKRYTQQWLDTFKNLGRPENFAYYYTSVGKYDSFRSEDRSDGNNLRGLVVSKYLRQGNHEVNEELGTDNKPDYVVNNTDREFSQFLSFGENYPLKYNEDYSNFDNSDKGHGSRFYLGETDEILYGGVSKDHFRDIASPYVTLKSYQSSQYGTLNSIRWVNTGYCGVMENNESDIVYGGDVFISRFSLKRKIPMFYTNVIKGVSDLLPFNYLQYRNIGYPRFWIDYEVMSDITDAEDIMTQFHNLQYAYNFDQQSPRNKMYVESPSKFYLFYYGIPYFMVESVINCNYRYAGANKEERFYPNVADIVDWTQEENLSIKLPETFYYNDVYSNRAVLSGEYHLTRMLPVDYNHNYWNKSYNQENMIIYSKQDVSEIDRFDPWQVYAQNDKHQFATANGKLIDVRGIESEQVIVRFENTYEIHNAVNQYKDAMNHNTNFSGTGVLFTGRAVNFQLSDVGFGGTQHKAMITTEFGHIWADSLRGEVVMVDSNGRNLKLITDGKRHWFKEHLPFKIIKYVKGMTHLDTDNNFIGLGIIFGYDSRFKRVFLTKRDYKPTPLAMSLEVSYDKENREFYITEDGKRKEIYLQDKLYFEDVSFTMAYSLLTNSWISYYSFTPDYYINHQNYFQTGVNSADDSTFGLWSHLLTNKSYQVYYGKKYPWTIELPFKNKFMNKTLDSVSYWLDSRRYHNDYDFAEKRNEGFNKAYVYNHSQNSGLLYLNVVDKNNMYELSKYPRYVVDGSEIVVTENDKRWSFNYFFNEVRDEFNNNPIWLWDSNSINKSINLPALDYLRPFKERLRGDWFSVILSQDKETRFKYIFKWGNIQENIYKN